jgi:hypothetical protein
MATHQLLLELPARVATITNDTIRSLTNHNRPNESGYGYSYCDDCKCSSLPNLQLIRFLCKMTFYKINTDF